MTKTLLIPIILIGILWICGITFSVDGLWWIMLAMILLSSLLALLSVVLSEQLWHRIRQNTTPPDKNRITLYIEELRVNVFLVFGWILSVLISSPWCEYDPSICEENLPMNRSIFTWGLCVVFIVSMIPCIFQAIREKSHDKQKWIQVALIGINRLIWIGILYFIWIQ
jgi:apolipoprotein N-acyltransferase